MTYQLFYVIHVLFPTIVMAKNPQVPMTDPVRVIQEALVARKKLESNMDEAMETLQGLGLNKAKEAMQRVMPGVKFPKVEHTSAIPHTGDTLRIDFDVSHDKSLIGNRVDPETGISFFGMKVDGPVAGIIFQVRVPLAQLSMSGIEKI